MELNPDSEKDVDIVRSQKVSRGMQRLPSRLLEIVEHFLHRKNDPLKADRALRKIVAEYGDEVSPTTVSEAERMIEVFMRSYY